MRANKLVVRQSAKSKDTRETLVAVAERLFAQKGIGAVALQEIAAQAGLANKFSVQYHFGGRDQLIQGVFARRLPQLEARRSTLLTQAQAHGAADTTALVEVLMRPIVEIQEAGGHPYAGFLSALYEFDRDWSERQFADELAPLTRYLRHLTLATLPHLTEGEFKGRAHAGILVLLDVIRRHDTKKLHLTTDQIVREGVTLG